LIPVNSPLGTEWRAAVETARAAGELVLRMRPNIRPRTKSDGSPLTDADLASAELIRRRLTDAFPSDRILTEEDDQSGVAESCHRCWIVDPIDGTSAYIKGIDDFDVYLSLIRDGMPVVAVTYQPTKDLTIAAVAPLDLISRELGGWSSDAYGDSLRFAKPIPNFPRGLVLARTRELGRRIVSALGAIQKQSGR
jgi:3'-phosphoadenosine 5'-phosphosulfate (PAPS) 3'-phosphatase